MAAFFPQAGKSPAARPLDVVAASVIVLLCLSWGFRLR